MRPQTAKVIVKRIFEGECVMKRMISKILVCGILTAMSVSAAYAESEDVPMVIAPSPVVS